VTSPEQLAGASLSDPIDLYLDLLAPVLTRSLFIEDEVTPVRAGNWKRHLIEPLQAILGRRGYRLMATVPPERRAAGRDWPSNAETMIGLHRLANLRSCIETVLTDHVPGDLIETGVWRGGASIYMRAVLAAHGDATRCVWLADSFRGLPAPDTARFPADAGWDFSRETRLSVGVQAVQANFERYGLLDDRVRFLEGWFRDTLPTAPIEQLAILRLDGDLYESTWQALDALYPKLSAGGFVIVDDYGGIDACRAAVHDYREQEGITDEIIPIDTDGVYWRRSEPASNSAGGT
jgi:O-methyltransferase